MSAPPYMPLYVADYLGDTRHLSTEQHGAYLLLLMAMWRAGGTLPNDAAKLARIAGLTSAKWARISADILGLFDVDGEAISHGRVQKELQKYSRTSDERRKAALRSREAKSLENNEEGSAIAGANAEQLPTKPEPEPEPTVSKATVGLRAKRAPSTKGSRLPEGWRPDEAGMAFAAEALGPNVDPERELNRFLDYWRAVPGAKGLKLDWPMTWRNWCRNAADKLPSKINGQPSSNAKFEARQANLARAFAAADRAAERIVDA